ncbi:MAG: matrixin family metalloprotease [Candidatus Binatia bacterium]
MPALATRFQAAYTFLGSPPARWFEPDSGQPVAYLVDATGDQALGFANSRAAVDAALGAWTSVATSSLVLQDGGTTAPGPFEQCSVSRIVFNDPSQEIPDPANCAGVLAMGGYARLTQGSQQRNFVQIATGKLTFNNGWGGCALWTLCNLSEVMAHELGHTIGLGHSSDSAATMYGYAHFDGRCASLRGDDIAGVSFIYPQSGPKPATPTVTPVRTQTPTLAPTAMPTQTAVPTRTPTVAFNPTATAAPNASPTPAWTATPGPTRTATLAVSPTATRTWTPTPVPTATPSVVSISGRIRYAGSGLAVPGVTIPWRGLSAGSVHTDPTGQFVITGLASAWWSIQPAKTGDVDDAVDVVDAATVLEAAVGLRLLSGAQQLACDTSGDGRIAVDDAVLILQYVVGMTAQFPAAQNCGSDWGFIPQPALVPFELQLQPILSRNSCQLGALSFEPLVGSASNQDFAAVAFGDCNGDWQSGGAGGARAARRSASSVRLGRPRPADRGRALRLPLAVDDREPFRTLRVDVAYDAAAMRATGVRLAPSAAQALLQVNLSVPGTVRLALASVAPIHGGPVATLEFESVGARQPAADVARATVVRQ